ncbi:hypothetical protein CC80DRAFT_590121 [Byssothecium circinans]|uniref:histidine kinase n=1 Tax=Byssothecium circinans TaxID=147558 RepID=A0A6A5U8X0_9PLEO|nr:hypothetical protein CC80DRAFT_590121 [Byssothecium circinans]
MNTQTRSTRPMAEGRRQREVAVRYGALFHDIPRLGHVPGSTGSFVVPSNHVPQPSKDAALTAFAQSACMRVGVKRGMVSLLDGSRQYILAEATPDLLLRSNRSDIAHEQLWLGAVSFPRAWGVYDSLLNNDDEVAELSKRELPIVTINDFTENANYATRPFVTGAPYLRFYAGVPLVSTRGAIIGTLSVLDNKPHANLAEQDILHLKDIADTIVEYLDLCMVREQNQRGEKLMRGLLSFAAGGSIARPYENESQRQLSAAGTELPELPSESEPALAKPRKLSQGSRGSPASDRQNPVGSLQESILPANARSLFARAASAMLTSSDLDGVIILDASVVGLGDHQRETVTSEDISDGSSSYRTSSNEEEGRSFPEYGQPSRRRTRKNCQILGFATPGRSDFEGDDAERTHHAFSEKDFARMFRTYPRGKVIDIAADGEVLSTDESDASQRGPLSSGAASGHPAKMRQDASRKVQNTKALRAILPEARSVAFVPLWDYERSRWFAGCLCWSNRPDRKLSYRVDLAYFKVFGNSIMADLSRLDAIAEVQAKSSFIQNVSHELRSPLHGILGTLEFLKDTALDTFQVSMINSLGACGQTLLDTVNHVLDYARITEIQKQKSTKRLTSTKAIHISSKPRKRRRRDHHESLHPAVDLQHLTEETVEAVLVGQSPTVVRVSDWDDLSSEADATVSATSLSKRTERYVILDIASEDDWSYSLPPGAWRRVVMNLLSNALKYTEAGYIHVSLRTTPDEDNTYGRTIHLAVKDSGQGMSQQFLANRAFQPFQQENSHSSGTGLGLSIIRHIVDSFEGKISVTSDQVSGTEIRVRLSLAKSGRSSIDDPLRAQYLATLPQLKGQRICILHRQLNTDEETTDTPASRGALKRFTAALTYTLTEQLKMEVIQSEVWEGNDASLVICPEPSFEYLASIRNTRTVDKRVPVTVFVAMDVLEAATLRTDVRVTSRESVVEIMMQPCGPYKLAHILDHCLDRFSSPEENMYKPGYSIPSPLPSLPRPNTQRAGIGDFPEKKNEPASSIRLPAFSINTVSSTPAVASLASTDLMYSTETETTSASVTPSKPPPPAIDSPSGSSSSAETEKLSATEIASTITLDSIRHLSQVNEVKHAESSISLLPIQSCVHPSRALITDDNPINRKLLCAFVKKKRMAYKEAENGAEAVEAYKDSSSSRFDVIFMDVSMPVMDGMAATRAIREYEQKNNLPRCYIIALTGLASASARLEAWSSGVDHYMTKPVNFRRLEEVLKDELERRDKEAKRRRSEIHISK